LKSYTKIDETDLVKYLKMDRDLAFKFWLLADIKYLWPEKLWSKIYP